MAGSNEAVEMLRHVAGAAGLELDEARLGVLAPRYEAFREFMSATRDVSLEGFEPAHVAPLQGWDDE